MTDDANAQMAEPGVVVAEGPDDDLVGIDPDALPPRPSVDHLITEDDTPVDNIPSEKNQRLLTEPLYSSWEGPGPQRPFLVAANVGVFASIRQSALVPDVFLSLDVKAATRDLWAKHNRSYFIWEFGKPPDVVIEIVSNREGHEADTKMDGYARMGVPYYVIFDAQQQLRGPVLQVFGLREGVYELLERPWLPRVGLGLALWEAEYEGTHATWLRWCDEAGNLIPTGTERAEAERERAEAERERAEAERERAEAERERAEAERQRAERLSAQLRALGIEPEDHP